MRTSITDSANATRTDRARGPAISSQWWKAWILLSSLGAWRRLHYASFVAFWMAFIHGLVLGSESPTLWTSVLCLGTAAPLIFLSVQRALSVPSLHGHLVGDAAARQPA